MNKTRPLRVLVVDDSVHDRTLLINVLKRDPQLELAGWAVDGNTALRAIKQLKPDVVTLDELMPGMDGLEVARRIMHEAPTPIVMISGVTGDDQQSLNDAASELGVLAVQSKQGLTAGDAAATAELVRVVKSMATVRLVRRRREPVREELIASTLPVAVRSGVPEIVAIGASTGGPQALREILTRLPASFRLPVLIVQHTTAGYSHTLVDWLQKGCKLPVGVAEHGESLHPARVYVAPTEHHLVVRGRHLELVEEPPCSLHRPSATVLFRSVAAAYGPSAVGILLTGMGDDGAAGLVEMKKAGAFTLAQDEQSSVVFGMPAEAIRLGAVDRVLPPADMPDVLSRLLGEPRP